MLNRDSYPTSALRQLLSATGRCTPEGPLQRLPHRPARAGRAHHPGRAGHVAARIRPPRRPAASLAMRNAFTPVFPYRTLPTLTIAAAAVPRHGTRPCLRRQTRSLTATRRGAAGVANHQQALT